MGAATNGSAGAVANGAEAEAGPNVAEGNADQMAALANVMMFFPGIPGGAGAGAGAGVAPPPRPRTDRGAGNRRIPAPAPEPTRRCRRTVGTTPPRRRTAPNARARSRSGSAEGAAGGTATRAATRPSATADRSRGGSASIPSPRRWPRKPTASTRDRAKRVPGPAGVPAQAGVPARARRRGGSPRSKGLSLRRIAKTVQTRRRAQTPIRAPIRVTPASRRESTRPTDAGVPFVVERAATVPFILSDFLSRGDDFAAAATLYRAARCTIRCCSSIKIGVEFCSAQSPPRYRMSVGRR